jgi:hypothetical protein
VQARARGSIANQSVGEFPKVAWNCCMISPSGEILSDRF